MLTISKIDRYDTINNPGQDKAAVTIWFSGCSMQCAGCYNKSLWNKGEGQEYTVQGILFTLCSVLDKYQRDTVVLLGGEPLEQDSKDLYTIVNRLHMYGYKVWLYTGREFEDIPDNIKDNIDFIKCGRYDESLDQTPGFPASSNQRVFKMIDNAWQQIQL